MRCRSARFFALIVLLGIVPGCAGDDDPNAPALENEEMGGEMVAPDMAPPDMMEPPPPPPDPSIYEPGVFQVGYATAHPIYPALDGTSRTITTHIWFPATIFDDGVPATYVGLGTGRRASDVAVETRNLNGTDAPYPVMLYSHSSGGIGLSAYPLGELFASHGWIVISVEHHGDTLIDDAAFVAQPLAINTITRLTDIEAVLTYLDDPPMLGRGLDFLRNIADTSRVYLVGHGAGAMTALVLAGAPLNLATVQASACDEDPDARACRFLQRPAVQSYLGRLPRAVVSGIALQAPTPIDLVPAPGLDNVRVPVLLQSAQGDTLSDYDTHIDPLWQGLNRPGNLWVDVADAGHYTFTVHCSDLQRTVLDLWDPGAAQQGCESPFVDPKEVMPDLRAYIFAHARTHLLDEAQLWSFFLNGPPPDGRYTVIQPD